MAAINTQIIQIQWDGAYTLNDIPELKHGDFDYGLYQIYGKHPLYGNEVLLYIGKADLDTFGNQLSQEGWLTNYDADSIRIFVGRLAGEMAPSEDVWSREIELAERLLIHAHKPAYNSVKIASVPSRELQDIHILNWGQHRDLLPEVSGLRWTNKLFEYYYEIYRLSRI
ncbi:hypothetical protein [Peribacillus sp. SCS-155]|uniref:hypothetical protein n=1 Tax=Peribacillus sedimenti TaxID=3115297 RepID=UPI0039058F64